MDTVMHGDGPDLVRAVIEDAEEVFDPMEALVKATKRDQGAPFTPEALEALAALKVENLAAFEMTRAQLKTAGCRMGALDEALAKHGSSDSGSRSPTQPDLLIQLGGEATLFHTNDSKTYADVTVAGHRETWPLRSSGFRGWLTKRYYEETGGAPNNEALRSALDVLDARARFDGPEQPVFVRVGEHEGRIYLDLANETWQAVEIDATEWRVVDTPPVRFRRTAGMLPLPTPVPGDRVDVLRRFLNVQSDADFVLVVAWLLACLRPRGPYPLLVVSGEQGSAKSTFSAMLRALVDPNTAPLRALPREDRDLFIAATNGHVLAFDNLSGLQPWISDTLCRLATGGGFAVRALYSDQDEILFKAARPMILNGIEDVVTRPDLADRSIVLQLGAIPEEQRRSEREIWDAFERERPYILGALLDGVVEGLRRLPTVHLERRPRMADFAEWVTACETEFWPEGTFGAAYEGNRHEAVTTVLEADPVAAAVSNLMADRTEWVGTASQLLTELEPRVDERTAKAKSWPEGPRALSGRLKRAATFLRKAGIEIGTEKGQSRKRTRLIRITVTSPSSDADNRGTQPSGPSAPSALRETFNNHNSLPAHELRTVRADADANADATCLGQPSTVRSKPLEHLDADNADGVDANCPNLSEQEGEITSSGWGTTL